MQYRAVSVEPARTEATRPAKLSGESCVKSWDSRAVEALPDTGFIRASGSDSGGRPNARASGVSAAQAGKVLAKLAKTDSRVQMKNVHNVRQYRLPPLCATDFYHHTDDFASPLTG